LVGILAVGAFVAQFEGSLPGHRGGTLLLGEMIFCKFTLNKIKGC
jgi:hypothetical protein